LLKGQAPSGEHHSYRSNEKKSLRGVKGARIGGTGAKAKGGNPLEKDKTSGLGEGAHGHKPNFIVRTGKSGGSSIVKDVAVYQKKRDLYQKGGAKRKQSLPTLCQRQDPLPIKPDVRLGDRGENRQPCHYSGRAVFIRGRKGEGKLKGSRRILDGKTLQA